MFWTYKKNLTRDCNKDKQGKLVFVPSERNCTRNVLMNWSDKLLSIVLKGDCSWSGLEMKSGLRFSRIKPCMSLLLLSVWEEHFRLSKKRKIWKPKLALSGLKRKNWKTKSTLWKMPSTKWKKETRRNSNKANKPTRTTSKLKKEQIKSSRKNSRNCYKVPNKERNDCEDFVFYHISP